jgi:hypothetical protein
MKRKPARRRRVMMVPIPLERFPIALLGDTRAPDQLKLDLPFGDAGAEWLVQCRGGLPGPTANAAYLAILRRWNDDKAARLRRDPTLDSAEARTLAMTFVELEHLMGDVRGGQTRESIRQALYQLQDIAIVARGVVRDEVVHVLQPATPKTTALRFGILEAVQTRTGREEGEATNEELDAGAVVVRLSKELVQLVERTGRPLDHDRVVELGGEVAQRLYRLLEAERYQQQRKRGEGGDDGLLVVDLDWLGQRLPLAAGAPRPPSQLLRALRPAHDELERIGYARAIVGEPTRTQGSRRVLQTITYRFLAPVIEAARALPAPVAATAVREAVTDVEELLGRGDEAIPRLVVEALNIGIEARELRDVANILAKDFEGAGGGRLTARKIFSQTIRKRIDARRGGQLPL